MALPANEARVRGPLDRHGIPRSVSSAVVFLIYLGTSLALYGRHTLFHLTRFIEGFGPSPAYFGRDQSAYTWSIAWVAHSIAHASDPIYTHALFSPVGYNLAWAASIIAPATFATPLTLAAGPIVAYNVLALLAPAVSAFSAFCLCRYLVANTAASFAGGLLYGFGSYETVETISHLNLSLTALIPAAVLLVLRRGATDISLRRFVLLLAALLAVQLMTSTEVLASMFLAGAVAVLVVRFTMPAWLAAHGPRLLREGLYAVGLATLVAAPFLYYVVFGSNPVGHISGKHSGIDLANIVVPTGATWLQVPGDLFARAASFHGGPTEQVGYLGIPLLAVMLAFAVEFRRHPAGRVLLLLFGLFLIAGLGRHLAVGGHATSIPLPWLALGQLPLLKFMLAGRLLVYVWLVAGIAIAYWISRARLRALRIASLLAVCGTLLPNEALAWDTHVDAPALVKGATQIKRYIPSHSTVLALPFGIAGNSMYWQLESGFAFDLAGGYISLSVPHQYQRYTRVLRSLEKGVPKRRLKGELCSFIRFIHPAAIIVRDGVPGRWNELLRPLHSSPVDVSGFALYKVKVSGGGATSCGGG
ncbi:MAG TPA: hypothetical protein VGG08_08830 [Solirubrobacteraceae bacterium]